MNEKYEIVDYSETKLSSYLQELSKILKERVKMEPIFYDLVSVELKEGKNYEVVWFSPSKDFSLKYRKIIDSYFDKGDTKNASHKSLLFLQDDIRHDFLTTEEDFTENSIRYENTYKSVVTLSDFTSDSKIPLEEASSHKQWWIESVLKKMDIACATFSKVTFDISQQKFSAALWIGFPKSTKYPVNEDNLIVTEIEKILWYHSLNTIATEAQSNLTKQAIRAAISQVMARNMSHNLGSHVMNKLVDADALRNFYNKPAHYYKSAINLKIEKTINDAFELIAIFNNYVKCRMDYLADITFGRPVMQSNKLVFSEIFRDFDKNRLLLDNISGINDFSFEIEFQFQGCPLNKENDIRVAMPNDILGCQALYNIIENVIRNTAKHNQNKNPHKPTKFIVNFIECELDNKIYEIEISDDLPIVDIDYRIQKQNETIDQNILDSETNSLRGNALGMIEMEASAAYLRKLEITEIDSNEYNVQNTISVINECGKFNIIKAFNKDGCLSYKFIINKPTEILLVGDYQVSDETKYELLKHGVWFETKNKFFENLKQNTVYNHQFLLFNISVTDKILQEYKTSLPTRKLFMTNDELIEIRSYLSKDKFNFDELEALVWIWWQKKVLYEHSIEKVFFGENLNNDNKKPNYFNVALLEHDNAWENIKQLFLEYSNQNKISNYFSYGEPLASKAQQGLPGFGKEMDFYFTQVEGTPRERTMMNYWKYANSNKLINAKLAEAVVSKVIVIDERIQFAANNNKYKSSIPFAEIYCRTGILLPEVDLGKKNYEPDLIKKIIDYVEDESKKINVRTDFILIHYSILERMFNNVKDKINGFLQSYSKQFNVIVTSGRGKPTELPSSVRYINLSPITNAFIDVRSKYLINYLLQSSRK